MLAEMMKCAVKKGDFTLASGKRSSYYIDIKKAYTNPKILRELVKEIAKLIKNEKVDRVAGVAVGGIPLAAGVSLELGIPFLIVRKEKKEHGTERLIEGELKAGEKIVVIEDVTTSGGSALAAVEVIREKKLICNKVIVVVDRLEGAGELLKKHDIMLVSLLTAKELLANSDRKLARTPSSLRK
ncbi:MAG: orotate phosphoribosyltransferase [Methanobacteriota archaeon]